MVDSIVSDIKRTFQSGNMISKIILVNVAIFIVLNLIMVFDPSSGNTFFTTIKNYLSLPSSPGQFIRQPWSILTHMFLHIGFWHILWNMLMLYWFGQIVGDFLGDRRILPIYILSGIFGGFVYMLHDLYLPGGTGGMAYAMGASAAVMAVVWSAAMTSPDYQMHLLLVGPVKLKYIALGLLFLDIVGSAGDINKGGHFAHIGGALWGMLFVYFLRLGYDLTDPFGWQDRLAKARRNKTIKATPRNKFKIVHSPRQSDQTTQPTASINQQEELDRILDKINDHGYENLTSEEKDFLYRASKKK